MRRKHPKIEDLLILVIGQNVWGRGATLNEALRKAQRPKRYIAYICHPETYVTETGDVAYPEGCPPKEFHRVDPKPR